MRVLVTGGTGFVGAHTTKALVDAGHDVRLLVRSAARIDENVKPLGVESVDYAIGDMTDTVAVGKAMEGCDAVVHAAAVVALDRKRADEVVRANPEGARVVIGTAATRGLDPIVYVSSVSAVFTPGVPVVHAELPPARAHGAYGRSKAEAEVYVRGLQSGGAPIVITYPSGILGPPAGSAAGEMSDSFVSHLKSGVMPLRDATTSIIDVRDVAAIHAAAMEPGRGPRRYMLGGHYLTMANLAALLAEVTGRRFPVIPIPPAVFRGLGSAVDALMRVVPFDSIFTSESMTFLTKWVPTQDNWQELGVELRDPVDTVRATISGLVAAGRVPPKLAGKLAGD